MKKKGQNENLIKALLAVLSVIAVCMVIVVVMVVSDHVGGLEQAEEISQTIETETPEEIVEREAEASETEEEDENPYYQYEGELSETPITPTEIENDYVLDAFLKDEDMQDVPERMREVIMERANEVEVYANPTVLVESMPVYNRQVVLVDMHTKDKEIMTIHYAWAADEITTFITSLNTKRKELLPVQKHGLYILNAGTMCQYLVNNGFSEEEIVVVQEKLIDTVYVDLQKNMPKLIEEIDYLYVSGWIFGRDTSIFTARIEFSSEKENVHGAYDFIEIDLRNDEQYYYTSSYRNIDTEESIGVVTEE